MQEIVSAFKAEVHNVPVNFWSSQKQRFLQKGVRLTGAPFATEGKTVLTVWLLQPIS